MRLDIGGHPLRLRFELANSEKPGDRLLRRLVPLLLA